MAALGWKDISDVSFNVILLFESIQLSWLRKHFRRKQMKREFTIALRANPHIEWYIRHKCPELNTWLDALLQEYDEPLPSKAEIRQYEQELVMGMEDWVIYVTDPAAYDRQPFGVWDDKILLQCAEFSHATVLDVGAGTGRLTFAVAEYAKTVYAVEPVGNLRKFIKHKAQARGINNVYTMDGLIEDIPFADDFADITMGGHVYGDYPEQEVNELIRVTKDGGTVVLCPGNNDKDNDIHHYLLSRGFKWERFFEPRDGWKRKYWLKVRKNP